MVVEKSEEFKKWENLPKNQRNATIQPSYNRISIKDSVKRSTYNKLLSSSSESEGYYNLVENISGVNVKNQQKTNSCWAFSFTNVLETSIEVQNRITFKELSPIHIDYVVNQMYGKKLGADGNVYLALAYCLNKYGPVYESDFKFGDYYNENENSAENFYLTNAEQVDLIKDSVARVEEATYFAGIYKVYTEDKTFYFDGAVNSLDDEFAEEYSITEDKLQVNRELIKKHIKEKGAVTAMMYLDVELNEEGAWESQGGYYNPQKKAFYCNDLEFAANHAVTIVGWKDDYSKDNFAKGNQPLNDGAYIVLNSWGEEFGEGGYFYVSYDDICIEQAIVGIDSVKSYNETNPSYYDKLYQHDELGMSIALWGLTDDKENLLASMYAANVYTRENLEKKEYLTEVGIYLERTEGVHIYLNKENDDISDSTLVASYTGENALEAGYHTIKLAEPVEITGEDFVVAAKYINSEMATVPIECDLYESGFSDVDTIYNNVTAKAGESYISKNGSDWVELQGYQITDLENTYTLKNANACIKAFTIYEKTETEPVTGVELDNNTLSIEEGKSETLRATVKPENATNKNVTWNSSNEEVATVNGGVVTAVKEGKTTITVTTEDGEKKAYCEVTVVKKEEIISVESVEINKTEITLDIGETESLTATVKPSNATNKNVTWSSSNKEVATVSGGVVTAVKEGEATITVITEDGEKKANCKVIVNKKEVVTEVAVQSVELNETEVILEEKETKALVATVKPSNATNKNITWSSSNEEVATVDGGVVTAVKEGETTITVTTEDGEKKDYCKVTVVKKVEIISVELVELNKTEITLDIGETESLVATVKPSNATNKNVTWSSSNEEVATVNGGVVTAVKEGETTITVTTEDGEKTKTCKVTVNKKAVVTEISVQSVELNEKEIALDVGETESLVATVKPSNATNKNVTWSSSNEEVATVDGGVVTAIKEGETKITVTTEDGEKKDYCKVTVVEAEETIPVQLVELNKTQITLDIGGTESLIATVKPGNATNKNVTWNSSNEEVATVREGVVTAVKEGETTITVTTEDGEKTRTCKITVTNKKVGNISVERIKFNKTSQTIQIGDVINLIVSFTPTDATNLNVRWESSDSNVATVTENGIITAIGEGKTIIKAISEDGNKEATCEITVEKKTDTDDDIYIDNRPDDTLADKTFPNAGVKIIISIIFIVLVFGIIRFINYTKLKDIK